MEVREHAPSPLDEVRSGLIVFEQSLWQAVPQYLRGIDRALYAATGRSLPADVTPIRFGSWIGGDRDGNPNVTADVTRRACLLARWVAATCTFAMSTSFVTNCRCTSRATSSAPLRTTRESRTERCCAACANACSPRAAGSTRRFGRVTTQNPDASVYVEPQEFTAALSLCERSLLETGYGAIAAGRLLDLRRRAAVFGMTLARLDVRQDASKHTEILAAVTSALGRGSYAEWDEAARIDFVVRELEGDGR